MAKGFLAFALSAVFLLSLVASGALLSNTSQGSAFQKYRFLQLQDIAIKHALYSSVSETASEALAASIAEQTDSYAAVKEAIRIRLAEFESLASSQGYGVVLWCGAPSEEEKQQSSASMSSRKTALVPEGTLPIASAECRSSYAIDVLGRKIHFSQVGFSAYFNSFGNGFSSQLPSGFEVDF